MVKQMTSQERAIGLVAVALFAGVVAAHAADFASGVKGVAAIVVQERGTADGIYLVVAQYFLRHYLALHGDRDTQH